jgi:hypothetical protein
MPSIESRTTTPDKMDSYEQIASPLVHAPASMLDNPSALHVTGNSTNLMSITTGNSVPMRGIPPIEFMSDCDLYKFYPYTAYFDRIPKYTNYANKL